MMNDDQKDKEIKIGAQVYSEHKVNNTGLAFPHLPSYYQDTVNHDRSFYQNTGYYHHGFGQQAIPFSGRALPYYNIYP